MVSVRLNLLGMGMGAHNTKPLCVRERVMNLNMNFCVYGLKVETWWASQHETMIKDKSFQFLMRKLYFHNFILRSKLLFFNIF